MRNIPEAVAEVRLVTFQVIIVLDGIQLTIEEHTFTARRHITVGQVHLQITFNGTVIHEHRTVDELLVIGVAFLLLTVTLLIQFCELLVLQLRHRLRENLLVGLVAQVFHKATLFCP